MDNTTKIFIAATLCKHTPATVKGGCKADRARLGEAIRTFVEMHRHAHTYHTTPHKLKPHTAPDHTLH